MTSLFVSDIHLHAERPATTAAFLSFLSGPALVAKELYILGDLFDQWIGDDAPQPENRSVLTALRRLTDDGISVWVMHGNHDFFYGARFAADIGCQLLTDPYLMDLYGTPTLLMHGDLLCTNDVSYQKFRKQVRDPTWQAEQLAKPAAVRLALAREIQTQSHIHTAGKDKSIMDVNQSTVESILHAHGAYRLIHGHTHHPAYHDFPLNDKMARRIVLPDWLAMEDTKENNGSRGGYLECTETICRMVTV